MLDSVISNMKENMLLKEEYSINDLIKTIKKHIEDNKDLLIESYSHEYNEELDIDKLLSCFDVIKNNNIGIIDTPYKNEEGLVSNNYVPYGVVGLVIRNDLSFYNLADIINVIIQSNNSLIVEPYRKIGTFNILLLLISQILTEINGINEMVVNDTNELLQNNNLDLLLYIGDKTEFNRITSLSPKKYYVVIC